jgi:1-acyl-sn-glycerol-3-phosphate acyltransferase
MKFCFRIFLAACEYAVFYLALAWFGLICLAWSLPATALYFLLPGRHGRRLGRAMIMGGFRLYVASLALSGRFRFDLSALDALRDEKSLIIAANHPSLWDAVLLVSRLPPDVACIMKADILNNIFLGGGARLAGYICNESSRRMIVEAIQDVQRGSHLLLFPEGTRTVRCPIGPLTGSVGVIAHRAKVPVQTVFIETDSPFLGKGWPVYKKPPMPVIFRVRLGHRFDPPENSMAFIGELERYFAGELGPKVPPSAAPAPVRETATVD